MANLSVMGESTHGPQGAQNTWQQITWFYWGEWSKTVWGFYDYEKVLLLSTSDLAQEHFFVNFTYQKLHFEKAEKKVLSISYSLFFTHISVAIVLFFKISIIA